VDLDDAQSETSKFHGRCFLEYSPTGCGGKLVEFIARMSDSIICDRAFEFASRILKLCEKLWRRGPSGRQIASELIRCGPSIGANAEEAQDAQTKPDFIAKMSISRKESRETNYWLRLALYNEIVTKGEVMWELQEVVELRAMIVRAIITAQSRADRGGSSPEP
jgi:four helix bundle protein